MPIPFQNYIDITSGVGGSAVVPLRQFITRIFTENPLVPTGSVVEFTNAAEVLAYFGSGSEEYKRAAFYFGWISKNITTPQKISYAFFPSVATAPLIYGDPTITQTLANWTSITSGSFKLTIAGVTNTLSALNFGSAGSLAAVAAVIQAAIRTETGTNWTAATVTYDSTRGSFDFVGGATGPATISVAAGSAGDIAAQLGWLSPETIISAGVASESLTAALTASSSLSNNFGSFLFIPQLSPTQIIEVATWNNGQNFLYMYLVPVDNYTDAGTYWTDLQTYSGVGVTLSPVSGQYAEMIPGMILAATDYTAQNSVQNYMFQLNFQGITASVTDGTAAAQYDAIRTNYYGNTQTAGAILSFYQRGTLMGGTTAATDMNVYANEMWLKDAAGATLMSLLLALAVVSTNRQGVIQITGSLQAVIDQALFNGTISVGKPLNITQQLYITQQTGSPLAWKQVQNIGYWLSCTMQSFVTVDLRTEWKAVYTLIYSKDDAVRKVQGTHVLI